MITPSPSRVPFHDETRRWGAPPSQISVFEVKTAGAFVIAEVVQCEDLVCLTKLGATSLEAHPALLEFAKGKEGEYPNPNTLAVASRLIEVVTRRSVNHDIHVDFEGALSFDVRLPNGKWLLSELFIDGTLDVSVYDDGADKWDVNYPCATESLFSDLF